MTGGSIFFHRRNRYCLSQFVTGRHSSLLFVTAQNCLFLNFNTILHFTNDDDGVYNFVFVSFRVRYFIVLLRASLDHDSKKVSLKYIV